MAAAELIQLVVDLVEDERFVVVGGEVPHNVVHGGRVEDVDYLDAVEVDHDAAGGSAGDVLHLVRLQGDLDGAEGGEEGHHHVEARLRGGLEEGAAAVVDADVT